MPIEQQYREQFIQWPQPPGASRRVRPARNFMSFGHLFFTDALGDRARARPQDPALSRPLRLGAFPRALLPSDEFQGNVEHLKEGKHQRRRPPVADDLRDPHQARRNHMYELNVVAWLASDVFRCATRTLAPAERRAARRRAIFLGLARARAEFRPCRRTGGSGDGWRRPAAKRNGARKPDRGPGRASRRPSRKAPAPGRICRARTAAACSAMRSR